MKTIANTGLMGETDFLRKQNNKIIKKQKKLKSIKLKGIHLLFILTLFSFIAFAIYKTGRFILTWEKLNIKSFKLSNIPGLKLKEVKNILKRSNGNILTLSLNDLRSQLVNIPEVKDASISRILPSTIEIRFLLRKPVFQIEVKGKYIIIDKEGVALYRNVENRENLITIKNIEISQQEKIIPYLSQLNSIKDHIDHVSFKEPYGILLKLKGIDETFYPGEVCITEKINYYLKLRKKLSLDKNKIMNVDLRFEDRFYLEYKEEVSH